MGDETQCGQISDVVPYKHFSGFIQLVNGFFFVSLFGFPLVNIVFYLFFAYFVSPLSSVYSPFFLFRFNPDQLVGCLDFSITSLSLIVELESLNR